jgi:ribosomal protein S27AE
MVANAERAATEAETAEDPMLFCPVCSTRLESRKCKLFCGRCGYYMSCADYY